MIKIKVFVFNAFMENTYVLSDPSGECIIIDPGCNSDLEKKELEDYMYAESIHPVKIIVTHCHVDHVLGCNYLLNKYNIPFEGHSADSQLLSNVRTHGAIFGLQAEDQPGLSVLLDSSEEISFGESKLSILHVPGHSPGSIALYCPQQNFVIVGDVLFRGSIGRTDLPGGNYEVLMNSIFSRLMTLPADTKVYSGHGPSTTIHEEALSNPFLA